MPIAFPILRFGYAGYRYGQYELWNVYKCGAIVPSSVTMHLYQFSFGHYHASKLLYHYLISLYNFIKKLTSDKYSVFQ
jgi:hypothetical protein